MLLFRTRHMVIRQRYRKSVERPLYLTNVYVIYFCFFLLKNAFSDVCQRTLSKLSDVCRRCHWGHRPFFLVEVKTKIFCSVI